MLAVRLTYLLPGQVFPKPADCHEAKSGLLMTTHSHQVTEAKKHNKPYTQGDDAMHYLSLARPASWTLSAGSMPLSPSICKTSVGTVLHSVILPCLAFLDKSCNELSLVVTHSHTNIFAVNWVATQVFGKLTYAKQRTRCCDPWCAAASCQAHYKHCH